MWSVSLRPSVTLHPSGVRTGLVEMPWVRYSSGLTVQGRSGQKEWCWGRLARMLLVTGCDHTAGGWTAFLAHAYASWQPEGTRDLAGLQEGHHMESMWGFNFFSQAFTKTKEVKKENKRQENLKMGSYKVND